MVIGLRVQFTISQFLVEDRDSQATTLSEGKNGAPRYRSACLLIIMRCPENASKI